MFGRKKLRAGRELSGHFLVRTRTRKLVYDKTSGGGGVAFTLLSRHIPPVRRLRGRRTLTVLTHGCFEDRSPTDLGSFM